jgi:hypothetical protein
MTRHFFEKYYNIKFYESPFRGSRVAMRTGRQEDSRMERKYKLAAGSQTNLIQSTNPDDVHNI